MKVVWTDPSIEDLRSTRDYTARDSEYYACDLIEQLILAAERLAEFPRLGRTVPEAHDQNIRELFCENYRIIYRIGGERVESWPSSTAGEKERVANCLARFNRQSKIG